jgi:hypothetical protein
MIKTLLIIYEAELLHIRLMGSLFALIYQAR